MSEKIQLGEEAPYPDKYNPRLLQRIARSEARQGLTHAKFLSGVRGCDIWNAYELSWLDGSGKPQVALAEFTFDCNSPYIIESKSFKYYLNSFNQTRVDSVNQLVHMLQQDLSRLVEAGVSVRLVALAEVVQQPPVEAICVDGHPISSPQYHPDNTLLRTEENVVADRHLLSHLLKSNCPVTGQPDWATLWVSYSGREICEVSFLEYVVSFRRHQDFHESCVERIFCDLMAVCHPERLAVYACYTRRGGLDINPFRSNQPAAMPSFRFNRQ